MQNNQKGFTLIEMLVAISIFVVIAIASNSSLLNFYKSSKNIQHKITTIEELQILMRFLDRDFAQVFNQEIKFEKGKIKLQSWQNGILRDIEYKFSNDKISRIEDKYELIIMQDINKIKVRVLDNKNKWQTKWRKNNKTYLRVMELTFDSDKFGKIKKQVLIDE